MDSEAIKEQLGCVRDWLGNANNFALVDKFVMWYAFQSVITLSQLIEKSYESEEHLIPCLEEALQTNWQFVSGSCLSYTALANHPVNELWIRVAELVAGFVNASTKTDPSKPYISVLSLLMPTVSCESIDPTRFDDLIPIWDDVNQHWQDIDIRYILSTHILGDNSRHLIPIRRLVDLKLNYETNRLFLAYHDYDEDEEEEHDWSLISEDETIRLRYFSTLTETIFDSKSHYLTVLNSHDNLLSQILRLMNTMFNNSVNGAGEEFVAGEGIYAAFSQFQLYFNGLSSFQKSQIPETVHSQILRCLRLASSKEAVGDVQMCLATMHRGFEDAINGQEDVLSKISLTDSAKSDLSTQFAATFHQTKDKLKQQIYEKKPLKGNDNLGITDQLVDKTNIALEILSIDDLLALGSLSEAGFQQLTDTAGAVHAICRILNQPGPLALLAKHWPFAKFRILIDMIEDEFFMLSLNEKWLPDWFEDLPYEHVEFLTILCSHEIQFVDEMAEIFNRLTLKQAQRLAHKISAQIPFLVKSASELSDFFNHCIHKNSLQLIFIDTLANIINNKKDYQILIQNAPFDVIVAYHEKVASQRHQRNYFDIFVHALRHHKRDEKKILMNTFLPQACNAVSDYNQLAILSHLLPKKAFSRSCQAISQRKCFHGFESENELMNVYNETSKNYQHIVFNQFFSHFCRHTNDMDTFLLFSDTLTKEQVNRLFENVRETLARNIQTQSDYDYAQTKLSTSQWNQIKPLIPKKYVIPSSQIDCLDEFIGVFEKRNHPHADKLWHQLKNQFPMMVHTVKDVYALLKVLPSKKRIACIQLAKTQGIATTISDYLRPCGYPKGEYVNHFSPDMISCFADFAFYLQRDSDTEIESVIADQGTKWVSLCEHVSDICKLPHASDIICSTMAELVYKIHDMESFKLVYEHTNVSDRRRLISTFEPILLTMPITFDEWMWLYQTITDKSETLLIYLKDQLAFDPSFKLSGYNQLFDKFKEADYELFLPKISRCWLASISLVSWSEQSQLTEMISFLQRYPIKNYEQFCQSMIQINNERIDKLLNQILAQNSPFSKTKRSIMVQCWPHAFQQACKVGENLFGIANFTPRQLLDSLCHHIDDILVANRADELILHQKNKSKQLILARHFSRVLVENYRYDPLPSIKKEDEIELIKCILINGLKDYIESREARTSAQYLHFYSRFFGGNSLKEEQQAVASLTAILDGSNSAPMSTYLVSVLNHGDLGSFMRKFINMGYAEPLIYESCQVISDVSDLLFHLQKSENRLPNNSSSGVLAI